MVVGYRKLARKMHLFFRWLAVGYRSATSEKNKNSRRLACYTSHHSFWVERDVVLMDIPSQFFSWEGCWDARNPITVFELNEMLGYWKSHHIFWAERDVGKLGDCSWKMCNFLSEDQADYLGDWLEKLYNILREIRMDRGCLSGMSAQFLQLVERARSTTFTIFFGKWVPRSLPCQTLRLTNCRVGRFACGNRKLRQLAKKIMHCSTQLCSSTCSLSVETVQCSSARVWLLEGDLVIKDSAKWLSVWVSELMHTWSCEHTVNMNWQQDASNHQDNIYSVWLTNDVSDKHETCDRSFNDQGDAFMIVHTTPFLSVTDVYIVNIVCTHELGPCAWLQHGCQCDIVTNMEKDVQWIVKQGGYKYSTRPHRWAWVLANIKWKPKGGSKIRCKEKFWRALQPLQHLATHWLNSSFFILVHW